MPGFFKDIEGDGAVISQGGVYRTVQLATRDGFLYAKVSGGYVRLMADGSTSKPGVRLDFMSFDGPLFHRFDRLAVEGTPNTKALPSNAVAKLLGAPDGDNP